MRVPLTGTRPLSLNTTTLICWRYGQMYIILTLYCHLWKMHPEREGSISSFSCLLLPWSHLQYLSYCMTLCPRAYSDEELLLLLTVVNKVSLDTRLILQPSVALHPLQYKILYNIRNWTAMVSSCVPFPLLTAGSVATQKKRDGPTLSDNYCLQLPRICLALTNLTDDHHNMCLLVQLLPHNMRKK